jgi:peptide/nickel transport system ATP-binding protein
MTGVAFDQSVGVTRTPVQLSSRDLTRHYITRVPGRFKNAKRVVRAVDDVSLELIAGKVTAVVGESGSGKSVLARMLARIVRSSRDSRST